MSAVKNFLRSPFMIKLRSWEYWPFGIIQFPLFFYYPWLSLRAGSLTFFSASNPGILMGGMFGESKFDVLRLVPDELKPKTILVDKDVTLHSLVESLLAGGLSFPLIFKPDIGERGFMVTRINNVEEAEAYLKEMKHDFLAQELVTLPMEFGVFYSRYPDREHGAVTSVVMKEMLYVEGDGSSTLQELIMRKDRARLQWPVLEKKFAHRLTDVIPSGEKVEIVSIGNHCLGTKFINANHLINDKLNASFDRISKMIPGFFFGRFDLRCNSVEDLENGKIRIMELNGCGAEPAHIYDPGFPLFKAVTVLIDHWTTIFQISRLNKKAGANYLPLKEAIRHYHNFKEKTQQRVN
jgi:hypothetical protein